MVDRGQTRKVLPGSPPVEIVLRRSQAARRISLRVSALDGRVTLSLPAHASARTALDFATDRQDWIRAQLARRAPQVAVGEGTILPVLGAERRVVIGSRGLGPGEIGVRGDRPVGGQVAAIVKEAARAAIVPIAQGYASRIGRPHGRVTLRDTRSRWGSCSGQGNLNFSWRLALAPPEVLDYVVAHEVAHLRHLDHSRAFWTLLREMCPQMDAHKAWLRHHGAALHAWRFDD